MARGMGAFAEGLFRGYTVGQQMERAQEKHDLEVAEREEKKAFRDELKKANEDLSVAEQFSVTAPDGTTQMFDNQDDALKVLMEGGDGFHLSHSFAVGDETFDNEDAAQYALRRANSDIGKMTRQAAVAMKYGQPQMAAQIASAADQIRASRGGALADMALTYKQSGNIDGLLNMFDQQAGDGGKARVVEQDGQFMIVRNIGGRDVPVMSQPAGSVGELFDLAALGFTTNYQNIVDIWKFEKGFGLQERAQKERERSNLVSEGLSAGNLAVNQARLGMQQTKHKWEQEDRNNPRPDVRYGYDEGTGRVVPFTTSQSRQPGGGWATTTIPGEPLPGVLGRAPQGESEFDRYMRELREGNTGGATPRNAWSGPPVDASGLVEMNNSRGVAPAAPTAPNATAPQGRFGDKIPDIIYDYSPGLRMTFPRSGGGN